MFKPAFTYFLFHFLCKVAFEGIVGNGFQGDIAIDDISVGQCSDQGKLHSDEIECYLTKVS